MNAKSQTKNNERKQRRCVEKISLALKHSKKQTSQYSKQNILVLCEQYKKPIWVSRERKT